VCVRGLCEQMRVEKVRIERHAAIRSIYTNVTMYKFGQSRGRKAKVGMPYFFPLFFTVASAPFFQ